MRQPQILRVHVGCSTLTRPPIQILRVHFGPRELDEHKRQCLARPGGQGFKFFKVRWGMTGSDQRAVQMPVQSARQDSQTAAVPPSLRPSVRPSVRPSFPPCSLAALPHKLVLSQCAHMYT